MKEKLKKISENIYELPKESKMLVPGRIFVSPGLLENVEENCIQQLGNVAQLPGIINYSLAMSDVHSGYGFPIGGVAAFDIDKGVISPGGVGYDINCSVRLLQTNLKVKDVKNMKEIAHSLFRTIPSGVGRNSKLKLSEEELNDVLKQGTQWAVKKGYGVENDFRHTEENGCLTGAEPTAVSQRARARGKNQLGTLGSGNHFLEIQEVEEIFDEKTAKVFKLEKGQLTIMIHCGSRGLGHQVASDYIKEMENQYGIKNLPDRELVNAPIKSELGKKYLAAMASAANFAFANKQIITHWIRENLKHYFPKIKAEVVYDICHNIAKFETHEVNGKQKELLVMRKGATRSFGPGRKEIPETYKKTGQPIFIPGSMGTSSYVLVGTKKAEELTWGSTAHGAGRVLSRTAAKKQFTPEQIKKQLQEKNIIIETNSMAGIVDEAPQAYKDVDEVVRVSHELGIGNLVAKLKPLAVVKG
ncbi:MAG: RtcB family protein [Nanoarchaeota archaeon]|nr:RtcB family protein [Nanoarchaeota archaeon]MBU1103548.1 RtcB family protein [Nanoarchaeota archaeon]